MTRPWKWPSLAARMLLAVVIGFALLAVAPMHASQNANDNQIQAEVQKALSAKRFSDVHASVANGLVTLTGSVDVYATKQEAEQKVHHKKGVVAVRNLLAIGGTGDVSDLELRNKLAEKLAYSRLGYGTTAFNSFTVAVQNGVVTLGGVAYGPEDKDAAVAEAERMPGVKDVVDNIEVAPVSPMDDRIRLDAARAIYGYSSLNRYAVDPAKPIRITVVNGVITLTGVVDSQADKETAGIRANGVPGAFKVVNDLQVAGQNER